MSSSRAGQWMPRPPAISRHDDRSSGVPRASRGYQPRGTAIVLPSASSTVSVSSLTTTSVAKAFWFSTVEECIPALQQLLAAFLDQLSDAVEIVAAKAVAA